jgi:uncharacterized repeat protein (TIGR03943 family)
VRLDPVAALRVAAVAAWAGLFDYLLISGESLRFVGHRTQWVVPFGAITLTLVALGLLLTLRSRRASHRPELSDVAGAAVLVAPVLALVMVPSPTLGAFAAERKAGAGGAVTMPQRVSSGDSETFRVAVAANVPENAEELGVSAGTPVELTGVVSDGNPGDATFKLSRFVVNCCAADATAYTVDAMLRSGTGTPLPDRWVRVQGTVARGEASDPAYHVMVDRWMPVAEPGDLSGP